MRKYGKYEKRPESKSVAVQLMKKEKTKQPEIKSVLLQTYFTSLLCLVLCVSMFLGTSYAWFISEVNNVENEIYVGTLKVGLYKDNESLINSTEKLFDGNVRWEPGYTYLETIKVTNEGDLAFNYELTFTDGTITDKSNAPLQAEKLKEVADYFAVWVWDYRANENAAPQTTSYTELITDGSGWDYVGSLADVLAGETVLDGTMVTVRKEGQEAAAINEGTTDGVATEDTYTIALHMKEDADASVMGHKISLNVKLIAYQMASNQEPDSFGNASYDNITVAANEKQLRTAMNNGGTVVLVSNIVLEDAVVIPSDVQTVLHLNGHNIFGNGVPGDSLIVNNGTLTIEGNGEIAMTFNGAEDNSKAVNAISNRGVLTVNSGTIRNTGTGNQIGYAIDNYNGAKLTVNGGNITASGSSYYDGIRLFCGDKETVVTVNDGQISSIWAQNPSTDKATQVKGTVIINSSISDTEDSGKVYYEHYTTVRVQKDVTVTVKPYGMLPNDTALTATEGDYTVHSIVRSAVPAQSETDSETGSE